MDTGNSNIAIKTVDLIIKLVGQQCYLRRLIDLDHVTCSSMYFNQEGTVNDDFPLIEFYSVILICSNTMISGNVNNVLTRLKLLITMDFPLQPFQ